MLRKFALKTALAASALFLFPAFCSAQLLIVGEATGNKIDLFSYNATADTYTQTGSITGAGLSTPAGLAYNSANSTLYFSNLGNSSIEAFNTTTHTLSTFASGGPIQYAQGIALDPSGNLYVSNYFGGINISSPPTTSGSILEYNSSGSLINTITAAGVQGGLLDGPTGLAYSNNSLYVVSSLNGRAFQMSTTGVVSQTYAAGTAPAGITVGPDGSVYYTTFFPAGTVPGSAMGQGLAAFNTPSGQQFFAFPSTSSPADVILGGNGNLLISDYNTGTISEYSNLNYSNGTYRSSTKISGLNDPLYMLYLPSNTFTAVPEPSSLALLGIGGVAGLVSIHRARQRAASLA